MISSRNPQSIRQMFDRIASRYDLLNTVLSVGTHWLWKRKLVTMGVAGLPRVAPLKILDCATGTGDIAELWFKEAPSGSEIIATDFSENMLDVARVRHVKSPVKFQWADVQSLPFEEGAFDRASISFGIRNVEDPKKALSELGRVVKPQGEVLVLEFGQPTNMFFRKIYRWYSQTVLPFLGGVLTGERAAYEYLNTSSAVFPCGEEFARLAAEVGLFEPCQVHRLTGGIAWIYQLKIK